MSELLQRAFGALGPGPTWRELELVADALLAAGDREALERLEAAAEGGEAFAALVELASEAGSSGLVALDLVTQTAGEPGVRRG